VIQALVRWAMAHRRLVLATTLLLALAAAGIGARLEFDALPDITGNQVIVLTGAPGYTPEETERRVTRPIEATLGGIPGVEGQRSLSRYGISAVTVIFSDATDKYLARQLVQERLNLVASGLPPDVDAPELAPVTGGLGEIFHFTLSSPTRTPAELYELATLEVAPLLRAVPGVVEVNTWGGMVRTIDIVADPLRMARQGVTLGGLTESLRSSVGTAAGASLSAGAGQTLLRAVARPVRPADLGDLIVHVDPAQGRHQGLDEDRTLVRLSDVATLTEGGQPRLGGATRDGQGETVYVMVQMLRGANALEVMGRIHERLPDVEAILPEEVRLELVYDRRTLVERTLRTVFGNLLEGGVLVVLVLLAMLGSWRAGILVAVTIPLSMLLAVVGMVVLGIPGNLMSLGAIDFGLLVDGGVVMVENFFHRLEECHDGHEGAAIEKGALEVAQPVFASVLIILLVYVPVVTLTGVDGKMFRPMATTVILALLSSLLLSLTFIPAASRTFLSRRDVPKRDPILVRWADRLHAPQLDFAMRRPGVIAGIAVGLLALGGGLFLRAGTTFVPQLDEGDLVIQTTRAPDISIESALRQAGEMEATLLREFPEVRQVVSRVGSPAVATDIMGLDQADVFVALKPKDQWRPGLDREGLIAEMDRVLAEADPQAERAFTQPIQMRFNELIGGETTDVAISVYGPDLDELRRLADQVAALVETEAGATDVRIAAPPAVELIEVRPRPLAAAQLGFTVAEILDAVRAVRTGVVVGETYDGLVRVPLRLRLAGEPTVHDLPRLTLPTESGELVPLLRLADLEHGPTPSLISHQDAVRRIVVGFNVRGGALGDVVRAAQGKIAAALKLPPSYRLVFGGQYETLQAATKRMQLVIPLVLVVILTVLIATFRRLKPALMIFSNVPFAGVGGMVALALRDLPISISAAVGFIALSGIAVLNGVVMMSRLVDAEAAGLTPKEAAYQAARSRMRPVLMTALVAALGFVPMMLASGAGAEVQRPLATVVVGGLFTSTLLTLVLLPALYGWWSRPRAT
jgi:cobalt-zinc-cadmium resistance protein CzcA